MGNIKFLFMNNVKLTHIQFYNSAVTQEVSTDYDCNTRIHH